MLGIVLGIGIAVQVLGYFVLLLTGHLPGSADALGPHARGAFLAAAYAAWMLPAWWLVVRYRHARGSRGRLMRFSLRGLNPALLGWAFLFMLAAGIVCEPLLALLQPPAQDVGRGIWTVTMLVVLAPLFEELICRGIVLGALRERYGTVAAIVFSSLFFGLLHIEPAFVVNAFVLGLVLGYTYVVTGSLWAPMLLHALNNALAYAMLATGNGTAMLSEVIGSRTWYVVAYLAALALTAVSAAMGWRTIRRLRAAEKNRSERNNPPQESVSSR